MGESWPSGHRSAPSGVIPAHWPSRVSWCQLADGREVVVKRRVDASGRSRTCVTAQRLLAEHGFPCPIPLTAAILDDGVAVHAEQFVGGGDVESEDTPAAADDAVACRRGSAAGS
jgi:hypothetical protein